MDNMTITEQHETSSPSSSGFLPSLARKRRSSVISMVSSLDKEIRSQALDTIHNVASRSDSLTTFNDYATSSSVSASKEGSGIAGDIQGSLSGLYSRIKESVGVSKSTPLAFGQDREATDDAASVRSERTTGSTPAQASRYGPKIRRNASPAVAQISTKAETNHTQPASGNDVPNTPSRPATLNNATTSQNFTTANTTRGNERPQTSKPSGLMPLGQGSIGAGAPTVASANDDSALAEGTSVPTSPKPASELSNTRLSGALEMLGAVDQKFSRQNRPGDAVFKTPVDSEASSINMQEPVQARLNNVLALDREPSASGPSHSNLATPPDQNSSEKQAKTIPRIQEPSDQIGPNSNIQQQLQLIGLARAQSASTAVSSASTTILHDDTDDEAAHAVGALPKYAYPNAKSANTSRAPNSSSLAQPKNRLLSKEYWMKDENAKDCFCCGDQFSTFRRRHHCRTCGQIFDSKCTTLVNGIHFGQSGSIRVCKPCESIINGYGDSSEFSDDPSAGPGLRPRHGSNSINDISPARSLTSLKTSNVEAGAGAIPSMAIPTRRRIEETKRRSTILEIDAEPMLPRPGSSRSLKSSLVTRQHGSGHKRHQSKHSLARASSRVDAIDSAPFYNGAKLESSRGFRRLPAFHSDNVVDPDVADNYLSDEGSSENEQASLAEMLPIDDVSKGWENEKGGMVGFLASARKRSRFGEKSAGGRTLHSRDADNVSLSSAKMGRSRSIRYRNLSVSSNLHLRASPRFQRHHASSTGGNMDHNDNHSIAGLNLVDSPAAFDAMERPHLSSSPQTSSELNYASTQHVRRMLLQLLQRSQIRKVRSWEKALVPIILQASNDIVPDIHRGDDIDIRHYIKLKKIPGGTPKDSALVSGIVFTKNLALKSMPRRIINPNVLILTFPLEYARQQRHVMSLEPLLRQEREYLQNLIHRIAALEPSLLLAEHNISGLALEFLEQAGIATAYNVKRSVLEAVSRFAQTRIITSIDKLSIKPAQAGRCASFYLKTFKYKDMKKTYMFLTGCPKDLGCTIVLRGADKEVLAKVKKITEFMSYVTYNLKLETCFMRDEFAFIPSSSNVEGTILPDNEPVKKRDSGLVKPWSLGKPMTLEPISADQRDEEEPGLTLNAHSLEKPAETDTVQTTGVVDSDEINLPDDIPISTFYSDMLEENKDTILSCSPFVRFMQPYLVVRAREQERRLLYLKQLREKDNDEAGSTPTTEKPGQFTLITPDMIHGTTQGAPQKVREVIRAVQDAQYEKAVHIYRTQKKQWEIYVAGSGDMFSPLTHQNIVVLYSMVCAATNIPCSGPSVLTIGFYHQNDVNEGFDADLTLGQFVEDRCLEAHSPCTENACTQKLFEHRRQYVHGSGQLSVSVEPYPTKLRGFQDTILMWSVCRICGEETSVTRMSDLTWRYSYGKYLELSFWSHDLHARAGTCVHDLHKEHFRYFGFKNLAVRFQYDRITLLEIVVPRTRITWKVSNDLKFKNEVFLKAQERVDTFMNSVKSRIKDIKTDSVVPEKADACKEEIERMTKLAHEHHCWLTQKLQEKYMGSKYYEIIPFNRAIRAMQEKCVEWDNIFNDFDEGFFPSERDIRRLAQLQIKNLYLNRDESTTSLSSTEEKTTPSMTSSIMTGQSSPEEVPVMVSHTRRMSIERAKDMLTAVVEDNLGTPSPTKVDTLDFGISEMTPRPMPLDFRIQEMPGQNVQHLDLAVPQDTIDKVVEQVIEPSIQRTSEQSPTTQSPELKTLNSESPLPDEGPMSPEEPKTAFLMPAQSTSDNLSRVEQESPIEEQPPAPRVSIFSRRKSAQKSPIPLYRAHSQPANVRREQSSGSGVGNTVPTTSASNSSKKQLGFRKSGAEETGKHHERKISDRFGLGHIKAGINTHSMIPRSITGRRKDSKVSSLAKHFEELSREFERERLRDKKQRASRVRQSRVFPTAAAEPIIEEYHNFQEAVNELDPSDEHTMDNNSAHDPDAGLEVARELTQVNTSQSIVDEPQESETTAGDTTAEDTAAETTENEDHNRTESRAESESEDEQAHEEKRGLDDSQIASEAQSLLTPSEAQLDIKIDLPKHEKISLLRMLTNFWAERSASGWPPLEYPLHPTDHVFADSDVIVREDEPSSLIAFVLGSQAYAAKLKSLEAESANLGLQHDKAYVEDLFLTFEDQARIERSLLQSTATHFKYQFQEGSAKMMCKVFFAEQFEAVRRKCGIDHRFIESLSRCLKWDSKGGKTKSVFLKTLDDRLVLKSLSPTETQAFVRFAPSYFNLMGEALFHDLPSVIAKMVGFFQVFIKNPSTGVEFNCVLLVMENLFYDRIPTRTFDLKGSMRNRRIQPTGEQNEVLLDENMVDYIYEKPLFAREHSKRLIWNSVFNDTLFLARQNVMD